MSVLHDWVMGTAPQIDEESCRRHRVGKDRVWHVGFFLLGFVKRDGSGAAYPCRKTLTRLSGVGDRAVANCLKVLEESGVVRRVPNPQFKSTKYVLDWRPSEEDIEYRVERMDPDKCRERGVGASRAFRVRITHQCLHRASAASLEAVTGIGRRQVREVAKMLGLELEDSRATRGLVPAARCRIRAKAARSAPEIPTQVSNTTRTPTGYSWGKPHRTDRKCTDSERRVFLMPWNIFSDSVTPDDSVVPARALRSGRRGSSPAPARGAKPLVDWTPMDSAKEFVERYRMAYPMLPGETGNVVEIAKVLGKWRKDYDHDARVEMLTLHLWLNDDRDVRAGHRRAPAWKRWLASFQRLRPEVDERLSSTDATYIDAWSKWERRDQGEEQPSQGYDRELYEQMVEHYAKPLFPHLFPGEEVPRRAHPRPLLTDRKELHDAYAAAEVYPAYRSGSFSL